MPDNFTTSIKYTISFLLLYAAAILYLHFSFSQPFSDFLSAFAIIGIGFSVIAWILTNENKEVFHKPAISKELWVLTGLILWIIFYITYGSGIINRIAPKSILEDARLNSIFILIKKLLVFVAVPFIIYKTFSFSLKDFGLKDTPVKLFNRKSILIFIILSIAVLLFQYFLGNGGKRIQEGHFSITQFIIGLPLCFIYLLFDAGLIEEFFFRGLLQSRLSVLIKSNTGAVIITAVIFGLVHAPGLYLRGAESEGMDEQLPFLFWAAYTIAYMSIAGIFLGIVYSKTKNLWLVMAIHAMVDLLPHLSGFIKDWHI